MKYRAFLLGIVLFTASVEAHKPITSKYNYNDDVFPIFNERCGRCHVAGGVAPMSLLTYKDALPWAESIRIELTAAHMPPWYAETGFGDLKTSHRLSPRELDVILTWATGGTPEGASKRLPAVRIKNDWRMGKPDLLIPMPSPFTLGPGQMEDTKEFVLQTATVDRWVRAVDLLPGAPAMVRDASLHIRSVGLLAYWLPGDEPVAPPAGAAFKWPAGSELVLRIHYRKTWTYEEKTLTDRSTVGLYLLDRPPAQEIRPMWIGPSFTLIRDVRALALGFEGGQPDKSMRIEAVSPNGTRTPLISLLGRPDWTRRYWFARPVALAHGTRIEVTGVSPDRVWLDVLE